MRNEWNANTTAGLVSRLHSTAAAPRISNRKPSLGLALLPLFVYLGLTPSSLLHAQIDLPGCGNENETACTPADAEYWANDPGYLSACDFGLTQQGATLGFGGTCVNSTRRTLPFNSSWSGWALAQQRYGIGSNTPLNYVTTIGTHNTYSNVIEGFTWPISQDQMLSITDQLQAGARYIRMDEHFYEGQMRLCHGSDTTCADATVADSAGRLFANGVKEVANWLNANPSEFIVLDLNGDPQGNNQLVMDPIVAYIGANKIVTAMDAPGCTSSTSTTCTFPNLSTLLALKRQVIIFTASFVDTTYTFSRSLFSETDTINGGGTSGNFWSCQLANNMDVQTRSNNGSIWPYTSEDRSGSDVVLSPSSFIGYLDENAVTHAATCGFSLIAFDYLDSRSHTYPGNATLPDGMTWPTTDTEDMPDNRLQSAVWSFDVSDYGNNQTAFLKSNGRWSTAPASTSMVYACSDAVPGTFTAKPDWVVTSAIKGPWSGGGTICQMVGAKWHFAAPSTGAQNANLIQAASGQSVWLNYQVATVASFAILPASISESMTFGQAVPNPVTVTIQGTPNGRALLNPVGGNASFVIPNSVTLGPQGSGKFPVSFSDASTLKAGQYSETVQATIFNSSNQLVQSSNLSVNLVVEVKPTISLMVNDVTAGTDNPANIEEGDVVNVYAVLTDPSGGVFGFPNPVTLTVTVTNPATGATTTATEQATGGGTPTQWTFVFNFPPGLSTELPVGQVRLSAAYPGDPQHFAVSSSARSVTVKPYLTVAPQSESISMPKGQPGSATPAVQKFVFPAGATATNTCSSCTWLQLNGPIPDPNNPKLLELNVGLNGVAAAQLSTGVYSASVQIADGVHQPASVPITLTVH